LSPPFTTAFLYLVLFPIATMETTQQVQDVGEIHFEGRSSSEEQIMKVETAKFSAESALEEEKMERSTVKGIGGILGILLLFNSIANVIKDIKTKKMNGWTYSRVLVDFTVSGGLIGYAFSNMLFGMKVGIIIGIMILFIELYLVKYKKIT
jgi:hypothetical protein